MLGLRPGRREAQVMFDWFKSYEDVAHLLRPLLPDKTARILILGCGNSTLSEDVCVLAITEYLPLSKHSLGTRPDYRSDVRRRVQKYSQRRRALVLCLLLATRVISDDGFSLIRSILQL
jgi:hypothetical protein